MPPSPPSLLSEEAGFLGVINLTVQPPVRLLMYTGRNGLTGTDMQAGKQTDGQPYKRVNRQMDKRVFFIQL